MLRKKFISSVMAFAMIAGIYAPSVHAKPLQASKDANMNFQYVKADIETIVKKLKKEGKIPEDATEEQIYRILKNYLKENKEDAKPSKSQAIRNEKVKEIMAEQGIPFRGNKSDSMNVQRQWNGPMREDKILVILMEFNDLEHNKLTEKDTEAWYDDFSPTYYSDMLFGDGNFKGQQGKDLITVREYYNQQSGGSYSIDGKVYGWYKSGHNAKYYGEDAGGNHNIHADELVREAIEAVVKNSNIDLSEFDKFNRETGEAKPDGYIDHLMIIHAGMGQEAGGGSLGDDAIWSHRSAIEDYEVTDKNGNSFKISDYTMEAEDGTAGLFCHEFGHDIGAPDEYDRVYSGTGDAVSGWSIMASGSWFGAIGGTEPTSFSPYCKQIFQSSMEGFNWLKGSTVNIDDIPSTGLDFVLDQASLKGENDDVVRVDLPNRERKVKDVIGKFSYFSDKVNENEAYMTLKTPIEVTTSSALTLKMKIDYDIEDGWDYFYVQGKFKDSKDWINLKDNEGISSTAITPGSPKPNRGNGITGKSNGWIDLSFDLSQITTGSAITTGSTITAEEDRTTKSPIELRFNYATDPASLGEGVYIDEIQVVDKDDNLLFHDDAEGEPKFELNTFKVFNGVVSSKNYYLLECRNHAGADVGLKHFIRIDKEGKVQYEPGLVVWYIDEFYDSNDYVGRGYHPGESLSGVVDAGQENVAAVDPVTHKVIGVFTSSAIQIHDAAFSIRKGKDTVLDLGTRLMVDLDTFMHPIFDDKRDYTNEIVPEAGRKLLNNGLKIYVTSEAKDRSKITIHLAR